MTDARTTGEWVQSSFRDWEKQMNGASSTRIHEFRRSGLRAFTDIGFPSTRNEEWRFTNMAPVAATTFRPVFGPPSGRLARSDLDRFSLGDATGVRLVFVDGHHVPEFSVLPALPKGVRVESLAAALRTDPDLVLSYLGRLAPISESGFTALNSAFVQDGALIMIPDGVALEGAIHLVYLTSAAQDPVFQTARNVVVAGKDSRLSVVETYHSLGREPVLTIVVSEVFGGERSVIEHDKLQDEHPRAYHVGSSHLRLESESTCVSNSVAFGGAIVRNNVTVVLAGERSEATLNGLSVGTGRQLIDNHTAIDHASPNCTSHELYKAVLDGESRGVFNGKILVRNDAQKTDAKQTNKTLILSDRATMNTKPQLEIFADDVKCTHGATVGQLEDEQVFYLRSRGIPLDAARDILTFAFAGDVIQRVHVDPLREQLDAALRARLQQGRVRDMD